MTARIATLGYAPVRHDVELAVYRVGYRLVDAGDWPGAYVRGGMRRLARRPAADPEETFGLRPFRLKLYLEHATVYGIRCKLRPNFK